MAGSKKGEHRGNARKRVRTHETPHEIMTQTVKDVDRPRSGKGDKGQHVKTVERRIEVSRVILGHSGSVLDRTPKEVMLYVMHHNFQAAMDWQEMLSTFAALPPTEENTKLVSRAEAEIERLLDKSAERARNVETYIKIKLTAIAVPSDTGYNGMDIITQLLDDVDARQLDAREIEHEPGKKEA